MDLIKAQRLLVKIQAFLDHGNGNELSRLEKDLMKSYITQLYEAVAMDEHGQPSETEKHVQLPVTKTHIIQPPPVYVPEAPKTEPVKPVFEEIIPPKPKEIPLEIKTPEPVPVVKVPDPIPVVNHPEPEPVPVEVPIPVPVEIPKVEPIVEVVYKPKEVSTPVYAPDALNKLFELPKSEDLSDRFSHVPIPSIESAMGLNERIFTLNDLFGGDRGLFDATCMQLNNLNSFAEAKALLLNGPARHFNWADPERIKMAEEFIRIIVRRYPKS